MRPRDGHIVRDAIWVPTALVLVLGGFILLRVAASLQNYALVVVACILVVVGLAAVAPRLRRA